MVFTMRPGLKDGNTPPICHVVGDKHNTAGDHYAFRGALKARPLSLWISLMIGIFGARQEGRCFEDSW
jgi:hypothetical protein